MKTGRRKGSSRSTALILPAGTDGRATVERVSATTTHNTLDAIRRDDLSARQSLARAHSSWLYPEELATAWQTAAAGTDTECETLLRELERRCAQRLSWSREGL